MSATYDVCLIIDCFDHLQAGTEKQFFQLLMRCDKNRVRPRVLALQSLGDEVARRLKEAGVAHRCLGLQRTYGLHAAHAARRLIKERWVPSGAVVMSCHFGADLFVGLWLRSFVAMRWVSAKRDLGFWMSPLHRWAMRWLQRRMDAIVVNTTQALRIYGRGLGTEEKKIRFIPNAVAVPEPTMDWVQQREIVRACHAAAPDETWFVCVGNIRPVKGQDSLIEAFARLFHDGLRQSRLVLVGEDRMNGAMQALAARLGVIQNILFAGRQDDVTPWLLAADIVVCPSRSEGMSNAVMEAMALGKPVIATAVGGNLDLIQDGVTGRLTACDPQDLAVAMREAAADLERARAWGEQARRVMKEGFSWQAVVKEYETLWTSAPEALV